MGYFIDEDNYDDFSDHSYGFFHYGKSIKDGAPGRGSGRYPLGSGYVPYQHEDWFTWGSNDFYNRVWDFKEHYKRQYGISPTSTTIANAMNMSRTEFDPTYKNAKDDVNVKKIIFCEKCKDPKTSPTGKVMSNHEIEKWTLDNFGERGRIPENTVTSLLNSRSKAKATAARSTANFLKEQVKEKGAIDIGSDTELYIPGCSRTKLDAAVSLLKDEGYVVLGRHVDQPTNPKSNNKTTIRVLCPPGTPKNFLFNHLGDVESIADFHAEVMDNGETKFWKMEYPASLDSKRIAVRYADKKYSDGYSGADRDGWIFIRRGCKDLDLGDSLYAQVRILVDDNYYIKGMASYYDGEFPEGADVIINSNRNSSAPLYDPNPKVKQVLKPISHDDPNNPFGAVIKNETGQYHYLDDDGNYKLGLINKKSEEGDWNNWRRSVASQFTSKQNPELIKSQIDISLASKKAEFESLKQLSNPVLKKNLLEKFASSCDSDAVDLRTISFPGQSFQVLVPIPTLKDNECYAPNYPNGTEVVVVRYPHAHISEIPRLIVNNKNKEGLELLGKYAKDCIGLNPTAEAQLSGADNDGDAAMVIPVRSDGVPISTRPPLKQMIGFDPEIEYPERDGMNYMTKDSTQKQMGVITNLIMDMGLAGANDDEMARAIKHSMVVIDAAKHKYDWQLSEEKNGIEELKKKYQVHIKDNGEEKYGGASTLLTRAGSEVHIRKRVGQPRVDEETGKLKYNQLPDEKAYWIDKKGKPHEYTESVPAMSLVDNAYQLMSNPDPSKAYKKEVLYADYANALKAMANEARKMAWYELEDYSYSKDAAEKYADEVSSLMTKVNLARRNKPRERMATIKANAKIEQIIKENPELKGKSKDIKKRVRKIRQQAIMDMRAKYNSKRVKIDVTPEEWEAIQNYAIDKKSLELIFQYADDKKIRQYATPKNDSRALAEAQQARIRKLKSQGWTIAEIASQIGISTSTVEKYANGG